MPLTATTSTKVRHEPQCAESYVRWGERTAGVSPPPTRCECLVGDWLKLRVVKVVGVVVQCIDDFDRAVACLDLVFHGR